MSKTRKIYRDKIYIDPEILRVDYRKGATNRVTYYCYYEAGKSTKNMPYIPDDPVNEFNAVEQTSICFAGLLNILREADEPYNRILYHMQVDPTTIKLSLKEKRRFIELSVLNKMLPKYVTPDTILNDNEGKMVLMIEDFSPSQLYVYLSQFRYIREAPGFVRSIVYLCDKHNFNFYAAFVVASATAIDTPVHHILNFYKKYGITSASIDKLNIPLSYAVGLSRFVKNPRLYDTRSITASGYQAAARIEAICSLNCGLKPHEFLEPLVKRILSSRTDAVSLKYLEKYLQMRKKIVYREKKETMDEKSGVSS